MITRIKLSVLLLLYSVFSIAQLTLQDSLVAHYKLDSDAIDNSRNLHHGTVYGAVAAVDRNGVSGGCLSFDGLDDYLDFGNIIDVSMQTEMSISAWFSMEQITSSTNRFCGVSFGKKDSAELTLRVLNESLNRFQSALYSTVSPASSSSSRSSVYTFNNWYHVVGIYEDGAVSLYVNGALQSVTASSGGGGRFNNIPSNAQLLVGKAFNSSNNERFFKGKIDDLRIYNRKLESCEIASLFNEDTGQDSIIAHYALDGHALDSSGNGFHGSLFGATPTSDRTGRPNSALQFDGIDDYVFVGNIIDPTTRTQLSIEAWFYVESPINVENRFVGVSIGTKLSGEIGLRVTDAASFDLQAFIASGSSSSINTNSSSSRLDSSLTYNTWNHVIATYANGAVRLYVNGILQNTVNSNGSGGSFSSIPAVSALLIGRALNSNNTQKYFRGKMDEVKIHNKALSSCDVEKLYQGIMLSVPENANEAFLNSGLMMYPNPCKNYLTLDWKNNSIRAIQIVSLNGSVLMEYKNQKSLNLTNLSSGVYILSVTNEFGSIINKKLIKQ